MKRDELETYEDLLEYLRTYTSWSEDKHLYDLGGIVHLMLALLDNLQAHTNQGDLDNMAYYFTDTQRQFIAQIAEYANRLTDEMIENERD